MVGLHSGLRCVADANMIYIMWMFIVSLDLVDCILNAKDES